MMKKGKGKAAQKAMKFAERREKAEKWVAAYDGTAYQGDIIKAYRKKFAVDRLKTVEELQLLGVSLTGEQIEREKAAVKSYHKMRVAKKEKRRRLRKQKNMPVVHTEQDDTFYYIAGYTSGGSPYGVTWEEMGLEPYEETED